MSLQPRSHFYMSFAPLLRLPVEEPFEGLVTFPSEARIEG